MTSLEFHISGQYLLWTSMSKIIWPPWLSPSGRLLMLASVYNASLIVFGSRLGKNIWLFSFLIRFTSLFISMASRIFMLLTLVLILHVSELMSGLEILNNQIRWPTNGQVTEISFCCIFTHFSVSCSREWVG